MTVYIHFHTKTGKSSVRLFNVSSVHDHGMDSIQVKMLFTDDKPIFSDVSHAAVQPEK